MKLRVLWVLLIFFVQLSKQKKYVRTFLVPYLHDLEKKFNGHFSKAQKKKILRIDGLMMPVYFAYRLNTLYHKSLTSNELKRATLLSMAAVLFDELFDHESLSETDYHLLLVNPNDFQPKTFVSSVAKDLQINIISCIDDIKSYIKSCHAVLEVQKLSLIQKTTSISIDEVVSITKRKGAISTIFCHHMVDNPMHNQMEQILSLSGALGQLCDDIYDMHEDHQQAIRTWPLLCHEISDLETFIYDEARKINDCIDKLPYTLSRKENFKIQTHFLNALSIYGLQTIDQKLKNKKPNTWEAWTTISKKELLIDVDHIKAWHKLYKITAHLSTL